MPSYLTITGKTSRTGIPGYRVMDAEQKKEDLSGLEEVTRPELVAVVFSVGDREFSIELKYLREISELSEVVPLPLSPHYIEGITHLRGTAIPVVNMARLKDISERPGGQRWLMVLEVGENLLGLVSDQMPDLSTEYRGEIINVPELYETYRVR